jgi:hypothetical protein
MVLKATQLQVASVALHLRHLQAESDLRSMASSASEKDQELNEKKAELAESTFL